MPYADSSEWARLTVKAQLVRWLHRSGEPPWGTSPDELDPDAVTKMVQRVQKVFGPNRYFGIDARGWHHLPPSPVLFVSNHSGGTALSDAWGFLAAWYGQFSPHERPLYGLAHELIFATEKTGTFFSRLGALRGDRQIALRTLSEFRRDVLVMPGGDQDTWRPHRQRYQVEFAGRTGYAWLALKAQVPIVPVAHAGAHDTLIVLARGRRIARAFGIDKLTRAAVFPVHLSFPWGLAIGPMPHLPPPTTLRYRFGAPIVPPAIPETPTQDVVRALDERVRSALQGLLDDLAEENS